MSTVDLDAIRAEWLKECGPHDLGVDVVGCACPDGDPRPVIAKLAAEVERLRVGLQKVLTDVAAIADGLEYVAATAKSPTDRDAITEFVYELRVLLGAQPEATG